MVDEVIEKYDPKEKSAAEYLSEQSYGDAYYKYIVAGGVLFAKSSHLAKFIKKWVLKGWERIEVKVKGKKGAVAV